MQVEPIYRCYESVCEDFGTRPHVIFMSPQGKPFTEQRAIELSQMEHILILCGHYEGVDQRVIDEIVDEEISIGDYVLTGGELGALVVVDALVGRLCEGVLQTRAATWTRVTTMACWRSPLQPASCESRHGREVPEVLQNGNHAKIDQWRREKSLENTLRRRPNCSVRSR